MFQLVEHADRSGGSEAKPHTGPRAYFKKNLKRSKTKSKTNSGSSFTSFWLLITARGRI